MPPLAASSRTTPPRRNRTTASNKRTTRSILSSRAPRTRPRQRQPPRARRQTRARTRSPTLAGSASTVALRAMRPCRPVEPRGTPRRTSPARSPSLAARGGRPVPTAQSTARARRTASPARTSRTSASGAIACAPGSSRARRGASASVERQASVGESAGTGKTPRSAKAGPKKAVGGASAPLVSHRARVLVTGGGQLTSAHFGRPRPPTRRPQRTLDWRRPRQSTRERTRQ